MQVFGFERLVHERYHTLVIVDGGENTLWSSDIPMAYFNSVGNPGIVVVGVQPPSFQLSRSKTIKVKLTDETRARILEFRERDNFLSLLIAHLDDFHTLTMLNTNKQRHLSWLQLSAITKY